MESDVLEVIQIFSGNTKAFLISKAMEPFVLVKENTAYNRDLNVRLDTIKLLEETRQNTLWHKS